MSLRETVEARLDAVDKTFVSEVMHLHDLLSEKFNRIETQIAERDTRAEQTSRDSKVAVDAAFAAAKEAVGEQNKSNALSISKSEAAFTKQIDQIGVLISSTTKGADDKIDDIKTRLAAIETGKTVKSEGLSALGAIILGVFVVLSSIASVAALITSLAHR